MEPRKTDVICLGQAVVDCISIGITQAPDQKLALRAETVRLSTGGDAVNESFLLTSMGYRTQLVCGLGEDYAGMILLEEAKKRGVGTDRISVIRGMDTPIANLLVNKDGGRRSVNSRSTMLSPYEPDPAVVKGARIVSFASLFRAPLDQKEIVCSLIRSAHEDGALICADTKLPTFRKLTLEDLKDVLPYIDYMFPNEKEAAYHTGEKEFERMAAILHSYGVKNVIIKAGELGCYVSPASSGDYSLPALPVQVVDTTGAGDSFVAGFISGLLHGEPVRRCCERALEQAAENVQHSGGVR